MSAPKVAVCICGECVQLTESRAERARAWAVARAQFLTAAEGPDPVEYERARLVLETARLESEIARLEVEHHARVVTGNGAGLTSED